MEARVGRAPLAGTAAEQAGLAELRYGRARGGRATEVPGEPHVQHLRTLPQARARRAGASGERLGAAFLAHNANDMRVPADDWPRGGRASFAAAHAPHRPHEDERCPGGIGEDKGLRPAGIEGESPATLFRVLGVEVVGLTVRPACDVAGGPCSRLVPRRPCRASSPSSPSHGAARGCPPHAPAVPTLQG